MRHGGPLVVLVVAAALLGGCGGDSNPESVQQAPPAATSSEKPVPPRPVSGLKGRAMALKPIGRFSQPLYVTQAPGDARRLFVVEKQGRVRVVRAGRKLARPFLSMRGRVSLKTEQGLLGLAFAPSYARSRLFYISYTDLRGNLRVEEWKRSKSSRDRAFRSSRRLVLRIYKPEATHNSGNIVFGPDGLLYVGVGDGGGPRDPRRKPQNRASLLGKILRIDPRRDGRRRYRSPKSNPFVSVPGARDEVYAYGLRNPWRFSFDRQTAALLIGDVGQEAYEEIDYRPAGRGSGANFGWSAYEGNHRLNRSLKPKNTVKPIHTYGRDKGCSVIGGYVVRDPTLPRMRGRYLYGDFCSGEIRSLVPHAPRARDPRREKLRVGLMSSFGEDNAGRIYVTSLNGPVYRLVAR